MTSLTERHSREEADSQSRRAAAKARLVVADDNPRVLDQLVMMLACEFDVAAYASNGREAFDAAVRCTPDALILDISMPVMSGLRVAEQLQKKGCHFPVVFLTVHDDPEYIRAAREAGGLGYVLKSHMASDLVPAIKAALEGMTFESSPNSH